MKHVMIALAFAATLSAVPAFAQSTASASPQATGQAAQLTSNTTGAALADAQSSRNGGQTVVGKTRAQVYQELVHAEQDGQLAYLNSTLFAHH